MWQFLIVALLGAGSVIYLATYELPRLALPALLDPRCNIKGNVSINSDQHIYHVPGQEDYAATKIDSRYGERWFCSEQEARAAGWRKARR